jgi:hypothetical protein
MPVLFTALKFSRTRSCFEGGLDTSHALDNLNASPVVEIALGDQTHTPYQECNITVCSIADLRM